LSAYKKVLGFEKEIRDIAKQYRLDWRLVAAIIIRESSANQYAIRVERGFWRRYSKNYKKMIPLKHPARRWLEYPDVFASSYGLMQIMFGVAYENGFRGKFPTELLDPEVNIKLGCKILVRKIRQSKGSLRGGLLKYNGGGDLGYPDRILKSLAILKKRYPE
tara:strand:+ start:848 stop:1333 length:486 start_codon:yes stop_codon:yes gene_type:complete